MTNTRVDLSPYLNAVCASPAHAPGAGVVNAWGNSFPLEEMAFGCSILLGGAPFDLPPKTEGAFDHIECLGQWIMNPTAAEAGPIAVIWVLGFGELGDQTLDLIAEEPSGAQQRAQVRLGNWLRPAGDPFDLSVWRASRLRYASGYDLSHLQPVFVAATAYLPKPMHIARLKLGANPLAHVVAITLSEQ